jgi:hypothetical protein
MKQLMCLIVVGLLLCCSEEPRDTKHDGSSPGDAAAPDRASSDLPGEDAARSDATTGSDVGGQNDVGGQKDTAGQPDANLATGPLPQGSTGIAAKHKGDVNIASDPQVIFADDFESYASAADLTKKWDESYQSAQTSITTQTANVYRGKQALELRVPKQSQELSNTAAKHLAKERDLLFLRYYSKFDASFDVVGSSHNGSFISAHYYINGQATPGVPADGKNKFLAGFECWRGESATPNPGDLNVYIYHPEQRSQWGDHFFPTGIVLPNSSQPHNFGPTFVARPDVVPKLGQWYCYELMVKANTPGKRDGRIACWLDGKLIADFPNLRLRDVATLKIDRFDISFHIGSNTAAATKKWYDNVVAASAYIGPLVD